MVPVACTVLGLEVETWIDIWSGRAWIESCEGDSVCGGQGVVADAAVFNVRSWLTCFFLIRSREIWLAFVIVAWFSSVDAFETIQDSMAFAMAMASFDLTLVHWAVVAIAVVAVSASSMVAVVATGQVGVLDLHVAADGIDHLFIDLSSHGGKLRGGGVDLVQMATLVSNGSMLVPKAPLTFFHVYQGFTHIFGGFVQYFSSKGCRHHGDLFNCSRN